MGSVHKFLEAIEGSFYSWKFLPLKTGVISRGLRGAEPPLLKF